MAQKINRNYWKILVWLLVIGLLVYTRFFNLGWGLPYPMHPDERNMAAAIQQLKCELPVFSLNLPKSLMENWQPASWLVLVKPFDLANCFNPNFFAYGQLPLYLAYIFVWVIRGFHDFGAMNVSFNDAVLSLRFIAALSSVLSAVIIIKIVDALTVGKKSIWLFATSSLTIVFLPFAIQFSHFGTTESLLMFFYLLIIYLTVRFLEKKIDELTFVLVSALFIGAALATKVSSLIFVLVPMVGLSFEKRSRFPFLYSLLVRLFDVFILCLLSGLVFVVFSPHNLINWQDFVGSMNYESSVALGSVLVFYTRQFVGSVPVLFQLTKIFPYALGWLLGLFGILGLLVVGWKDKRINILRVAFLIYFLPNSFLFAKWTRFMAPIFPIVTIFALILVVSSLDYLKKKPFLFYPASFILALFLIIPGISYLSIYQKPDVRFQATDWINKNIPPNSVVLSETANVVDIPLVNANNLDVISFNFYDLDVSLQLQQELKDDLAKADYIFVPSRRIFANSPKEQYPLLNKYYQDLFSGKLGFQKVAEFSSGLDDEQAEETWTVFDHPVIRIYKKVKS
ncbi:glycosyltransferase family 39 protein [Patescibacteria group bacterium]|nr:glycosyltransferase family 39 protein [Patescibacteria group bacterium]